MFRLTIVTLCSFSLLFSLGYSEILAKEWSRSWHYDGGACPSTISQESEFLLIKDLELSPHGVYREVATELKFEHGQGAEMPLLLVGERERIFSFVFIATQEYEGSIYCVTTRVLCIPEQDTQPFVWEPRGFKKNNSMIPEEDPRVELRRLGLLPAGDFDFWYAKEGDPITWATLQEEIEGGYVFTFPLELKASRPDGYEIPSTIDPSTLRARAFDGANLRISFEDEGLASLKKERVFYEFILEKRYGFDSAHIYRPIGESNVLAHEGVNQSIEIPSTASYLSQDLELQNYYRIKLRIRRPSYGSVQSERVKKAFLLVP